jgi:hypothetical protein
MQEETDKDEGELHYSGTKPDQRLKTETTGDG